MTPQTDVCHYCENFRVLLKHAVVESEKLCLSTEFKQHVKSAQDEREHYLATMKQAKESLTESETTARYGHYTFDFAQMLQVPYHARQVGPLYFKVPLKVQLFDICDGSTNIQIILMNHSTNGTNPHGPNSVVSMLHHFFENHSGHEPECHLYADNCVGQNEN